MELSVGIAAGGKSSRFGSDKRLALFEGRTFLDHAIHTFLHFDDIILSVDEREHAALTEKKTVTIVVDKTKDCGPIEAIHQILLAAKEDTVFIFPMDMPFVTEELALYLSNYVTKDIDAVCPIVEGRHFPLCAIYRKSILPPLIEQQENKVFRLMSLLGRSKTVYVEFPSGKFGKELFLNCNTQEEYRMLLQSGNMLMQESPAAHRMR